MYDVVRTFGVDYIYFDLIFLALFLGALLLYGKKVPLIVFFAGGLLNFLIDWGIWLHTGVREVALPDSMSTLFFFLWFSLSYGVEYAYVFLMFDDRSHKIKWTLFILFGWFAVALLSQWLPVNDDSITTLRHMEDLRIWRVGIVIIGYGLLFLLGYNWRRILFLFSVGFLIHFMMELALFVSGIRPGSLWVLFENSLIEFNMGVPFFYLLWDKVLRQRVKGASSPAEQ